MLKQKPLSYYQSSIFSKKQKKRSTSTSANKENLSISHNNSSSIEPNASIIPKSQVNTKNSKNSNPNKQRSRKTKKSQTRQRSTSKLSSVTKNLGSEQHKLGALKVKQSEGLNKKTRKSRNNSSSMILAENSHINVKNSLDDQALCQKIKSSKYSSILNSFHPQMSKSSTIISSSTGNIQFSQLSRDDQQDKNYDFLNVDRFGCFIKPLKTSQKQDYRVKQSSKSQLSVGKFKLTPTKAAIMIQKTWRGYLTRKLLEEYIDSFEPMYQEQLKDIRSGRQSRQQARSMISSNKKCHQKSSFFDRSQIQECSQIQPFYSHVQESFRTTTQLQNDNYVEKSSIGLDELKQSSKNLSAKLRGNEEICDLPVQFFKKPIVVASSTRHEEQSSSVSKEDEFNCSSRRKNAMKITPETASRVSEFTVKQTAPNASHNQSPSIQQTLKYPSLLKSKLPTLSLCPKTTTISISPSTPTLTQQLSKTCEFLSTLFHSFNSTCINEIKTEVKLNRLSVNQLMERKDALKDILDNGMEFVKNVEDQIAKAFDQMKRIVRDGVDTQREENHVEIPNEEMPDVPKTINPKKQSQSPLKKISNQKYINQLQSPAFSSEYSQFNSSSSRKPNKKGKNYQTARSGTSQFYTIDLPTEEYSAKGKSPIQQDYDEQDNDSESSYKQDQSSQSNQQSYTEPTTLRLHPLYASHQQSIQILNQFLLNLIEQYQQISSNKNISQLQYLCETLKRVSCDSQNRTIVDRCLIQFIVEIMAETWSLKEIFDGFRKIVQLGVKEQQQEEGQAAEQQDEKQHQREYSYSDENYNDEDWKLLKTIRRWIQQLYKWQMNIIQEVPSKMQSSSFINTENISFHELKQTVNNLSNPVNFQLDFDTTNHK